MNHGHHFTDSWGVIFTQEKGKTDGIMFISLEGIEGSGKTTQLNHILYFLESKGHKCVITREPGGTRIGKKIRTLLLDPDNKSMDPMTELLLYTADRVQHMNEIISPALLEGKTVICDRFFDATLVYQGYARGLNIDLIKRLHKLLINDLYPDITILFDLSPKTGLSRAWKQIEDGSRTHIESRFEKEALLFHEKVRAGYLDLAHSNPDRFIIIDSSKNKAEVQKQVIIALTNYLNFI